MTKSVAAVAGLLLTGLAHGQPLVLDCLSPGPPTVLSPAQAMLVADVAFAGKVVSVERDPVEVALPARAHKFVCAVAVVRVVDSCLGTGALTQVRVAFPETMAGPHPAPMGLNPAAPAVQAGRLVVGQGGLFCLQKTPQADLLILVPDYAPLPPKAEGFAAVLKGLKVGGRALESPLAAMADDEAARYQALAFLLERHRTDRKAAPNALPSADVPPDVNRRMLELLAAVPWEKPDPRTAGITLRPLFTQMGPTAEDGWAQPPSMGEADFEERTLLNAVRKWVLKNSDTIKLKRFAGD